MGIAVAVAAKAGTRPEGTLDLAQFLVVRVGSSGSMSRSRKRRLRRSAAPPSEVHRWVMRAGSNRLLDASTWNPRCGRQADQKSATPRTSRATTPEPFDATRPQKAAMQELGTPHYTRSSFRAYRAPFTTLKSQCAAARGCIARSEFQLAQTRSGGPTEARSTDRTRNTDRAVYATRDPWLVACPAEIERDSTWGSQLIR